MFASTGLLLWLATAQAVAGAGATSHEVVADAITRAVRLRLGDAATIVVSSVDGVRIARSVTALLAAPEPAARLGGPMRFLLSEARPGHAPVRVGEAVAVLDVSAPTVQARRAIARGEQISASDVAVTTVRIGRQPLRRMLALDEAIGARAARDISADTVVTRADLTPVPLVSAGDVVRAHVRFDEVEVVAEMVAAERGSRGKVIRVINRETRHAARARVIARGEVEVIDVR